MNLQLTGHHVEITPALREYAGAKLKRVIRHFDSIIEIAIVLGLEKPADKDKRQRAEVNLRVKGNVFHIDSYAQDLYSAIDSLVDKLDRLLVRHKEKTQTYKYESAKYVLS